MCDVPHVGHQVAGMGNGNVGVGCLAPLGTGDEVFEVLVIAGLPIHLFHDLAVDLFDDETAAMPLSDYSQVLSVLDAGRILLLVLD